MKPINCIRALLLTFAIMGIGAQTALGESPYEKKSYNEFKIGYDLSFLTGDKSNLLSAYNKNDANDGLTLNGVNVSLLHGFAFSNRFFVEAGITANYNTTSYETRDYSYSDAKDVRIKYPVILIDGEVPVNCLFDFHVNVAGGIMISPFIGGHFKYNLTAKQKQILNARYNFNGEQHYNVDKDHWEKTLDYFDKDICRDNTWERIQYGPQAGFKIRYSKFVFTGEYEMDFPSALEDCNTSRVKVALGYRF